MFTQLCMVIKALHLNTYTCRHYIIIDFNMVNTVLKTGRTIAPFAHIFMFWRRKNKFLRHPGTENLLQHWLQMRCERELLLAVHYK